MTVISQALEVINDLKRKQFEAIGENPGYTTLKSECKNKEIAELIYYVFLNVQVFNTYLQDNFKFLDFHEKKVEVGIDKSNCNFFDELEKTVQIVLKNLSNGWKQIPKEEMFRDFLSNIDHITSFPNSIVMVKEHSFGSYNLIKLIFEKQKNCVNNFKINVFLSKKNDYILGHPEDLFNAMQAICNETIEPQKYSQSSSMSQEVYDPTNSNVATK